MPIIMTFEKDPDSLLDYFMNWADWLEDDDIATSTWFKDNESDPVIIDHDTAAAKSTTVWLDGGGEVTDPPSRYIVTNRITTTGGRRDDRSFAFVIKHK